LQKNAREFRKSVEDFLPVYRHWRPNRLTISSLGLGQYNFLLTVAREVL
jgi:hypothetical protein